MLTLDVVQLPLSIKAQGNKKKAECESVGSFIPFSIELYGLMHESAILLSKKLTQLMYRAGNEFSSPKERSVPQECHLNSASTWQWRPA